MKKIHPVLEFILLFAVSLVGVFLIITNFGNPFLVSFVLAIIISFLGIKDAK